MKHTNNLKLALYESDDAFNITGDSDSLNSNMNIIDESINSLNNEKASKALYGDTTINIGRRANTTVGEYSTAEGNNTIASGKYSHTEGSMTTANGNSSHAEGNSTTAQGIASHSEGQATTAKGNYSHAEGYLSKALGDYSHAGGSDSIANSLYSFAHGKYAIVNNDYEVAFGKYNTSNTDTLFSVGDGTLSDTHNAFEITTDGGKLHDKDIATSDMLSEIQNNLTSHTHDSRYYTEAEIDAALAGKANTSHTHTKSEITDFPTSLPASDVSEWAKAATKPTYTASEVGADASGSANTALTAAKAYTDTEIAGLINGAPTTLDTLGEIATAMSENQSVVEALNSAVGTKANVSDLTAHTGNTSNPHNVTKAQIGLENVPNVSTNDQTPTYSDTTTFETLTSGEKISVALGKIKLAITNLINHIANKNNPHEVTKSQIGLGNVGNYKAVSTVAGQGLTEDEKANARTNIGAGANSFSGDYNDLSNKPVVDTALSSTSTNPVQNKVINAALNGKAANSHTHDDRYYTEAEIDAMLDEKAGKDAMTGATSSADGMSGLVPSPSAGNQEKFLRADGTWDIAFSYDYVANNWFSPSSGNSDWHTPSSQEETKAAGRYVAKPVKDLVNGEDGYNARIITVFFPYSNTTSNIKGLYLYEYSQHQYTIYYNTSIKEQGFQAGDVATFFSCRNQDRSGQFVRHHLISVQRADSIIYTDFFKEFMFSDLFYETFNSNLKIKRGNMSFKRVTSATQYDVTFDTPFENVPNIQLSYTDSSASSSSYVSLISSSKTGFSVKGSYLTGFNWLAIGV